MVGCRKSSGIFRLTTVIAGIMTIGICGAAPAAVARAAATDPIGWFDSCVTLER